MEQKEIRKAQKIWHGMVYWDIHGVKNSVISKSSEKVLSTVEEKCPSGNRKTKMVSGPSRNKVRDQLFDLIKKENSHRKG